MSALPKLAFIGVGNMGNPMAMNLVNAGYSVNVFDIDPAKTSHLQQAGSHVASSLRAAVTDVDAVMVSLHGPT